MCTEVFFSFAKATKHLRIVGLDYQVESFPEFNSSAVTWRAALLDKTLDCDHAVACSSHLNICFLKIFCFVADL